MRIIRVPIAQIVLWEKNPRGILKVDFERLKRQIRRLGVYKPLVACRENGKYVVLGGNMRIRALQELGFKEVDVSVVEAKTEREKIEISLSDNDRAGYYEEEKLAELVQPYLEEIDLEEFKVDLRSAVSLKKICEGLGPGGDENADLNEELSEGQDLDSVNLTINIPRRFKGEVVKWLANGERENAVGMGNGILKRCGLL